MMTTINFEEAYNKTRQQLEQSRRALAAATGRETHMKNKIRNLEMELKEEKERTDMIQADVEQDDYFDD